MNMKTKLTETSAIPEPGQGVGEGVNKVSRVAISTRVWAVLGILTILLVATGVGLIKARGKIKNLKSALQLAQFRVEETDVQIKNALADKNLMIKELSAQGDRLTEFSLSEEQARSELTSVTTGVETSEMRLTDLKSRLAKSQRRLRALRRKNAVLTRVLNETRARQKKTQTEMERYRALAEPYNVDVQRARQPGQ